MTIKDNGGHAFPTNETEQWVGMTLRDWFAGQALISITAGSAGWVSARDGGELAGRAYAIADAMLAERSK